MKSVNDFLNQYHVDGNNSMFVLSPFRNVSINIFFFFFDYSFYFYNYYIFTLVYRYLTCYLGISFCAYAIICIFIFSCADFNTWSSCHLVLWFVLSFFWVCLILLPFFCSFPLLHLLRDLNSFAFDPPPPPPFFLFLIYCRLSTLQL